MKGHYFSLRELLGGTIGMSLGIAGDLLFIMFTRLLLEKASEAPSVTRIGWLISLNVVTLVALIFIPTVVAVTSVRPEWIDAPGQGTILHYASIYFAASNLLTAAVAGIYVAVALLLVLHRAIWAFLGRPVFALAEHHILLARWSLIAAGTVWYRNPVPCPG